MYPVFLVPGIDGLVQEPLPLPHEVHHGADGTERETKVVEHAGHHGHAGLVKDFVQVFHKDSSMCACVCVVVVQMAISTLPDFIFYLVRFEI